LAKIDILVPSYDSPLPQVTYSINQMLEFSRCKCNQIEFSRFAEDPEYKPAFHEPSRCPNGKHDIAVPPSASMSIIHWARNAMVMQARKDCDYVLFNDSDISTEPDALERLLLHEVDIVAGLCTRRTDPAIPNWRQWIESAQNYGEIVKWNEDETLQEVDAVGTGFMLISRACLEHVAQAYHPELYAATGNGFWFEFLRAPHLNQEFGEDVSFCLKAQRLGYKVWVDTTVQPSHWERYPYGIKDYLPFQDERLQAMLAAREES
jgi:hypothetical protein